MTRLAANRDTHLTPEEIASEALRQFDAGEAEPSIRSLATALKVAPSAIYHHYGSRAEIIRAAVEMVWQEATAGLLELVPRPYEADPADVLIASGVATRRAWLAHFRLAPYMAATPESSEFITDALGLMAAVLERFGLRGERAAAALHTYSSFMIGAVLFAAARCAANEQLEPRADDEERGRRFLARSEQGTGHPPSDSTRLQIDEVMDLSVTDPDRDEELFVDGLRRLVATLASA